LLLLLVKRATIAAAVAMIDGGESLKVVNHILKRLKGFGSAVLVVFLAKVSQLLLH
jgi:hypothetical protein